MKSYRELWLWLGAAFLTLATALAAIALAYFTKEQYFSLYTSWQMLVAIGVFVLAFVFFLGAILVWPFPPWVKPRFPDITVDIYSADFITTEREVMPNFRVPASLLAYKARITNMEKEQNASLTIRFYLKLVPGSRGRVGETIARDVDWVIDPSLGLDPLPETLDLAPGTSVNGNLVYEVPISDKIAEPRRTRFVIEDHISAKRMEKILEGNPLPRFTQADMSPAKGGVEILGPEYEVKPVSQDEDKADPGGSP